MWYHLLHNKCNALTNKAKARKQANFNHLRIAQEQITVGIWRTFSHETCEEKTESKKKMQVWILLDNDRKREPINEVLGRSVVLNTWKSRGTFFSDINFIEIGTKQTEKKSLETLTRVVSEIWSCFEQLSWIVHRVFLHSSASLFPVSAAVCVFFWSNWGRVRWRRREGERAWRGRQAARGYSRARVGNRTESSTKTTIKESVPNSGLQAEYAKKWTQTVQTQGPVPAKPRLI